jgi:hypothetical protein
MDSYSPELALLWLRGQAADAHGGKTPCEDHDMPSRSQQEALDALAERVSAARSIV